MTQEENEKIKSVFISFAFDMIQIRPLMDKYPSLLQISRQVIKECLEFSQEMQRLGFE